MTESFLENISGSNTNQIKKNSKPSTTNIFFDERIDLNFIADLINEGDRVLDLGCENGDLLNELKKKNCKKNEI